MRYCTGFTGSSGALLLLPDRAVFVTDGRYALQAGREAAGCEVHVVAQGGALTETAARLAADAGIARLGFESAYLTVDGLRTLEASLPPRVALVPVGEVVERVKAVKEPDEIEAIRRACRLADDGCAELTRILRPGITEREAAWRLEVHLRTHGATRLGFDTIVGSGPNGAIVHGRAGARAIGASGGPEFVLVDFGCEVDGYNADITRTFVVGGDPTPEMATMYAAVQAAQQAAVDAVAPGVAGRMVDGAARAVLAAAGMPPMPHNTGHGLGRLVHDMVGVLTPTSTRILEPGMVVTVEPGAYVDGFGGVRIEDDVLVTRTGAERLTHFPRDLTVLG